MSVAGTKAAGTRSRAGEALQDSAWPRPSHGRGRKAAIRLASDCNASDVASTVGAVYTAGAVYTVSSGLILNTRFFFSS